MTISTEHGGYADEFLWIDALCINQQDRAAQVKIMSPRDKIYGIFGLMDVMARNTWVVD